MFAEILKSLTTESIFYAVASVSAVSGIWVYYSNSRLERARWLTTLYEKFYERDELKGIRDMLDMAATDSTEVATLVREEKADFTDYLNFFEYIAVLEGKGARQLSFQDVKDLFEYYLRNLASHATVREYIEREENGYEKLRALLRRLDS